MLKNPDIGNPTSFDELSSCKRFFILGHKEGAHRLHLLLAGQFETKFFGFFTKSGETRYDDTTMFLIRPLDQYIDRLGQGDYVFLLERDAPLEEMLIKKGVQLGYPFNLIAIYRTYEAPVFNVFLDKYFRQSPQNGVALDIGANFGLTASMMVPYFSSILAFEPNRTIFANLTANHTLAPSIQLHQYAFGSQVGVAKFYDHEGKNGSIVVANDYDSYEVDVETVDHFCATHDIAPRFIKIDAEGLDGDIILSSEQVIKTCRPICFFENPTIGQFEVESWNRTLDFLNKYYVLKAFPCLNQLVQNEHIGIEYSEFQKIYEEAPLNIGAIPK